MDSHRLLVVCSGGSREEDRGTVTVLDARRAEIFCKFSLPPPSPRPQLSLGLDPPAWRWKRYRAVHAHEGCVICDRNAADFQDHSRYSKVIIKIENFTVKRVKALWNSIPQEKKGANIEGEGRPLNAQPESANKEDKSGVSSRRDLAFDVAPYSKEERR